MVHTEQGKWHNACDMLYEIPTRGTKEERMNKMWKILEITDYKNGYTGMHCTMFLLLNRCGIEILKCKNVITNPYSEATSKQSL